MYMLIHGSLDRQKKGLVLLQQLLNEEFSLLMDRKTEEIMALEFSIHSLLRQLAGEKIFVQKRLNGGKVIDYSELLSDPEQTKTIKQLWQNIDTLEQDCSRQASLNAELSLALLDQSKNLLSFLHKNIQPQETLSTYGRSGAYNHHSRPEAALLSGRL